jgi:hypothetical protein
MSIIRNGARRKPSTTVSIGTLSVAMDVRSVVDHERHDRLG